MISSRVKCVFVDKHYQLLMILTSVIMCFQLWVNYQKFHYSFDGSLDFINYYTLGRQLIEFCSQPIFLFPGKTFDGTTNPCFEFFPGLLLGYHEAIPWVMLSLCGTIICFLCYVLARLLISRSAGIITLILAGALDPFIITHVFKYAYVFDEVAALCLSLGVLAVVWNQAYRKEARQPGSAFCFLTGLVAGLIFYSHPVGSNTISAAVVFLLLSLGINAFTWRIPVAVAGALTGTLPMWLFALRHGNIVKSWMEYSQSYPGKIDFVKGLFSKDGYLWFLLSPSKNIIMMIFLGTSIIVLTAYFVMTLVPSLRNVKFRALHGYIRNGLHLYPQVYGLIVVISYSAGMIKSSGMTVQSAGWGYGIEPWFWLIIAGAWMLDHLVRRMKPAGICTILVLMVSLYSNTIITLANLPRDRETKWKNVCSDANDLIRTGNNVVLASSYTDYMLFALGPKGMVVSERFDPWVKVMADTVEQAVSPAIISSLNPATLGADAWQTTSLKTVAVHHSFNMPDSGSVLPNSTWKIIVNGQISEHAELARDNRVDTAWLSDADFPGRKDFVFTVLFDKPRTVCRIIMMLHREGDSYLKHTFPQKLSITAKLASGEWVDISANAQALGYFWDGGRLFFAQRERNRFDIRFKPIEVVEIKFEDRGFAYDPLERKIDEMYVFESSLSNTVDSDLENVLNLIRSAKPGRVLADRFISAQVRKIFPKIQTWIPPSLRFEVFAPPPVKYWPWTSAYETALQKDTVIVADHSFSGRMDQICADENVRFEKHEFGQWTAYKILEDTGIESQVVWNGMCLALYPHKKAAQRQMKTVAEPPANPFSKPVHFSNGATLISVEPSKKEAHTGETITVKYYWTIPDGWDYAFRRPTVFSHLIRDKKDIVNDDHLFLGNYNVNDVRESIPSELFIEERSIKIPEDAAPGNYLLETGLHLNGERVQLETKNHEIKTRKKAARLPFITVTNK